MDQRILLGGAIVFIAIVVLSFYLYQQQLSQPVEEEFEPDFGAIATVEEGTGTPGIEAPTYGNCPNIESQYDRDLCWSWQAGEEKNVRLCDNIQGESRKVICIEVVAIELLDTQICSQEFPDNKDRLYSCITGIAREELDYSLCEAMPPPYKGRCLYALEEEERLYPPQ